MALINIACFFKKCFGPVKQLAVLLFIILCAKTHILNAASYKKASNTFLLFKAISHTPLNNRVSKAEDIYKANCRQLDEHTAMALLDSLAGLAKQLHDNALECSIYLFRADYYSVNKGFNAISINDHQEAIDFARAHEMPVEAAIYLHKKGLYYFTFHHNIEACKYFLQAYDDFKRIGFSKVPDISRYVAEQAQFYYALRDFETAKPLLHLALSYPIKGNRIRINLITTIGLIHRKYRQFPQALYYFNKALKVSQATKDSAWIAISTGNIGSVYFMQKQYAKALPYLAIDYQASIKYQQYASAATSLLCFSYIDIQNGLLKRAAMRVDSAEMLIQGAKEDVLATRIEIYNQRRLLSQKRSRYAEAIAYMVRYQNAKDSLEQRDNVASVERVKLKWETEKYRYQLQQLKTQTAIGTFKRNAVIFILFLMMIIVVLVFNRYRLNTKRDQELLIIKKRRVDEQLKNAAESLKQYTENLKQNNLLIEKFKAEIERFKIQSTDRAGAEKLEQLMQAHIMTDETWDEFKKLFTKVHNGFFLKLRQNFPYFTDTDTRLLSLIKLGLNNREMSNMLGITIEGIKKSKQRLRKKMQLATDKDIEQVIAEL